MPPLASPKPLFMPKAMEVAMELSVETGVAMELATEASDGEGSLPIVKTSLSVANGEEGLDAS
jgi:hypothetical protein